MSGFQISGIKKLTCVSPLVGFEVGRLGVDLLTARKLTLVDPPLGRVAVR